MQTKETEKQIRHLETRRYQVRQGLQIEEIKPNTRLETALIKLRDKKPELFTITIQDQVNKLTGELATSFIKWLIE